MQKSIGELILQLKLLLFSGPYDEFQALCLLQLFGEFLRNLAQPLDSLMVNPTAHGIAQELGCKMSLGGVLAFSCTSHPQDKRCSLVEWNLQ